MNSSSRWRDFSKRAVTFVIGVPVVVAFVLAAPNRAFLAAVLMVFALAAREIVVLGRRSEQDHGRRSLSSFLAIVYCLFLGGFIVPLHAAQPNGPAWVILLLAVSWGGDVGGYLVGKSWGGRKLCPSISPGKTVAGSMGSMAMSLILTALVHFTLLGSTSFWTLMGAAVIGNLLSQTGDLLESAFKRRHGTKDSGSLLPGHGGVLDCIDGLILAAPWFYWVQGQ